MICDGLCCCIIHGYCCSNWMNIFASAFPPLIHFLQCNVYFIDHIKKFKRIYFGSLKFEGLISS